MEYQIEEGRRKGMDKHGALTNDLGSSLEKELTGRGLTVYHDHGKESESVGEMSAFFGDVVHRDNKLAEVDIAILDKQKEVILLIEVEENDDRPKTVIGDAMSTLLSDRVAFKSQKQELSDEVTLLILAKDSKVGHKKRIGEIKKRIDQMLGNPIINRLRLKRVELELFGKPEEMKGIILDELSPYLRN